MGRVYSTRTTARLPKTLQSEPRSFSSFRRAARGLTCEKTPRDHTYVYSAKFSSDGTKIVSASSDTTVRVWDVATGACEQTLHGRGGDACYAPLRYNYNLWRTEVQLHIFAAIAIEMIT